MGLEKCVFWGADYPHYDCTYPGAVNELQEHLAPLDQTLADLIRHENAARLIGLG
jgi:predicted TIM-barrel fold metal-dependent hydrolase